MSEAIPITVTAWVSQAQPILRKAPRRSGPFSSGLVEPGGIAQQQFEAAQGAGEGALVRAAQVRRASQQAQGVAGGGVTGLGGVEEVEGSRFFGNTSWMHGCVLTKST